MVNPVSAVSRVEALAASIGGLIAQRGLQPGERITTVAELREQTGLAKQTITETLRLLADRGVIEIRPGRNGGAFVAKPDPVVRLRQTLLAVPVRAATVADAVAVRDAMEELVCCDAARHRSTDDVADLRKLLTRMRRATGSVERFMSANWALHERIASITPNEIARAVYLGTVSCIRDLSTAVASAAQHPHRYLDERVQIHARVVEAIAAGDVEETIAAVREHRGSFAVQRVATD